MTELDILERLVSFPSVVGQPNSDIVQWIADYARSHGAEVTTALGPEGDRSNLFATIGPKDVPGVILSGHMDVVPAGEADWSSDPFALRADGDKLYGRGTSDMKGFLACALAALPEFAKMPLKRPVHLAFSYDEEAGCKGVPHLIKIIPTLCALPEMCIVGEPSGLRAIRAHKGKAAARITIHGRSGHSSRPDQGLNAIHAMSEILTTAVKAANALTQGPFDNNFEPPYSSLQVGTINGGQAVNIIPDLCVADIEARAISGVSPAELLEPLRKAAEALRATGFDVAFDTLSEYPALSLAADAPLTILMHELTGIEPLPAVSYGTEAGLYQAAGIDSIICGPGDIARAHKANEFITRDELTACRSMLVDLGTRLSG
ncbi:acetylornithine deacetylase [Agrobacterium rubi]|uniref:Acetylornithine deacetylase n=1 Tax=Agrobacterium rubi TaxID=28099 RepID=A0AAE7RCR0_9HYPH|nr:acetylornithine deacetylase [Agrobacterium rubi]NTE88948.1 acetylornithine deacetylase [Agrobacterium rubi]NTF04776.1 acetylornithine deacetylase [Agrobacterium rubi]NTF39337.1 acetylornithine deacetylase [Agrobacterium rubi]OCJ51178.1 acetylornithine deacetylase (ArgE) [Agrobacterium rubi]QTG02976.1 acetylornithine deacetylase [Agrobacterium rubi]